ncbi:hypothetical protein [Cryptosporidium hominis TU502]|uniref:hypothetical protein n=1 Tax=Cryptosporidium hominis (strain TU502) TaxID=353151 RepID=UPI0000452BF8|nr:hypothetical protein [Cryptosporidium hominis TU502]
MESSIIDHKLLEKENMNSNMIIFHYIKVQINNNHIIMENNLENNLVICKFEILEIILQALKSLLKAFGNEFLLSMGI